ncbi:prepilin-type N-terminal cleavage/methylation domain-containing protein [Desulfohalobiaceae bacterium Ax17]|uniref:PilW family protein n=1 Tax=Desulfovulcanus ferrireducens TaxID=2831190 RepID=UPI00207B9E7B|nr:prepilin-type N-terminal cleavage/methylation domain-containing protein [Desulfovulcanus ferrireducens]MBT8762456.1 prepilin-type N-terminal cleavage/methylation domain-containing protein [Desulfovulcanus ferrireducens]
MNKINHDKSNNGFTLIELLVVIAISGILLTATYSAFQWQHKSYHIQEEVAEMQQDLRAAMDIMVRETRMAGYDPKNSGKFGITDIRRYDLNGNLNSSGFSAITFTTDLDGDGTVDSNEIISYSIYDYGNDNNLDLARKIGGSGRQLLAENIDSFVLAYAYDDDRDGELETNASNDIIWAIDKNNDGKLEYSTTSVAIDRIRAVRIWILTKTGEQDPDFLNTNTYVVGNQIITRNDKFRRRLLTTFVQCRNMGL